jgi:DNA-binding LacI/PurR family transcriptional regulator
MNAALAQGLVVGQDIAVTGYDNVPMSEFLFPPLTTVKQPIQEAGEASIDLLLRQINGDPIPQKNILLEPELIIRQSS